MTCLNDAQIQAVADGEASGHILQHAAACAQCAERVRARQQAAAAIANALDAQSDMPPHLSRRVDVALGAPPPAGATRLRSGSAAHRPGRRVFWSAAAAGATLVAVFVIAPLIKEPATVSASGIRAASASRLADSTAAGVEVLEYELVLDGMPRELMPDHTDGTYRVKKLIDHGTNGRFRYTSYTAGGQLATSIAQDPVNGRRVMLVRIDGQLYRFESSMPADTPLSLPDIERLHMQASISLMQASGNQHLRVIDTPDGTAYRIEVPKVSAATTSAVWDLTEAQVVIDAGDYRIVELAVKGAFLKQPYSVTFRQLAREVIDAWAVPAGEFEVPDEPGAITLRGEGTAIPARDALVAALQELARLKQAR